MALRRRAAGDGVPSDAGPVLAGVGLGAGVAVVAACACLGREGARAGSRLTDAGIMALGRRAAGDGVPSDAGPVLAGVGLGAGVAVVAACACLGREGARAGSRLTDAGIMALGRRAAGDGVPSDAGPVLAGVGLGTGVAVVAACARLEREGARAGSRLTDAGIMALRGRAAGDGVPSDAGPHYAGVGLGAGVAVVAACARLGREGARAGSRLTDARIMRPGGRRVGEGGSSRGGPDHSENGLGAGVAVVAACARLGREGARAGSRLTDARSMALWRRAAGDGVPSDAGPVLAGVGLGAGVAVVAACARLGREGARAGSRLTDARIMALRRLAAGDGGPSDAGPALTASCPGTDDAVFAACAFLC